jgi:sugar phosphate permease
MGIFFNAVTRYLDNHSLACTIYAFIVAFSAYFCMYAFRKPFTAAEFNGMDLWGIQFKILLIIFQVIGYALSKFSGIVIISQLDRRYRGLSICGCVVFAELTLVGFGAVPRVGKPFFMFLNGLPLGLIWGMVSRLLKAASRPRSSRRGCVSASSSRLAPSKRSEKRFLTLVSHNFGCQL